MAYEAIVGCMDVVIKWLGSETSTYECLSQRHCGQVVGATTSSIVDIKFHE